MEATKEEKKKRKGRKRKVRRNSISLILLATSTITLLLHRYISFPFTGCAPVIPFTDPLCSSFPSRNIGFIFPIKIHRNTCIFFPFFPSMVQLSVSYRGRERGSWNKRGKKYQLPPRIALIKTPCISLITQYRFRCLNSDPRATPRLFPIFNLEIRKLERGRKELYFFQEPLIHSLRRRNSRVARDDSSRQAMRD